MSWIAAADCLLKLVTAPDGEAGNLFLSVYLHPVHGHVCGVHGDADEIGIYRQSLWLESRAGKKEGGGKSAAGWDESYAFRSSESW